MVRGDEIEGARRTVGDELRDALAEAIGRTRRFNERLLPVSWFETMEEGITVGVRFSPLPRVGVYVPAGKGRFPSTCVTIVTPAVVAGVEEIAVLAPPRADGGVDPALVVACDLLGVHRIFRCNGVAATCCLSVGARKTNDDAPIYVSGKSALTASPILVE